MIGVLPSVSPTDVQGVMGLIAFLADPKSCEDRLKELNTLAIDLQDKSDALAMSKSSFSEDLKVLEQQQREVENSKNAVDSLKRTLQESLDAQKIKTSDFASQVKAKVDELTLKTEELAQREKSISSREEYLQSIKDKTELNLSLANKTRQELEAKLTQLRALAG